jgi:hypothetical protein
VIIILPDNDRRDRFEQEKKRTTHGDISSGRGRVAGWLPQDAEPGSQLDQRATK